MRKRFLLSAIACLLFLGLVGRVWAQDVIVYSGKNRGVSAGFDSQSRFTENVFFVLDMTSLDPDTGIFGRAAMLLFAKGGPLIRNDFTAQGLQLFWLEIDNGGLGQKGLMFRNFNESQSDLFIISGPNKANVRVGRNANGLPLTDTLPLKLTGNEFLLDFMNGGVLGSPLNTQAAFTSQAFTLSLDKKRTLRANDAAHPDGPQSYDDVVADIEAFINHLLGF